jgi:putative holliday junction resolvase
LRSQSNLDMGTGGAHILSLDVGSVRIGLALADQVARLAVPYKTIHNDEQVFTVLREICQQEAVGRLVVGRPRGMDGQSTAQTVVVEAFGRKLEDELELPIAWQDEAVTSVRAEAELRDRRKPYRKEDIDMLAATYILEDYLYGNV